MEQREEIVIIHNLVDPEFSSLMKMEEWKEKTQPGIMNVHNFIFVYYGQPDIFDTLDYFLIYRKLVSESFLCSNKH